MNNIIGKKVKMDQIFSESDVTPVTWVSVKEPEVVEFVAGSLVKIVGVTKGKGFQGVVKRHGFAGGPRSHGQKNRERAPGSLGPTAPQRVIPGRRMAGRMGGDRQTLKKIEVVEWKAEDRLLALKGSLPGRRGSKITIFV
jgi:large subunit ribosomal protein L3